MADVVVMADNVDRQLVKAPWTPAQVEALNKFQQERWMHPFTCGSGNRTDEKHTDGEGILVATENGWICPFCDYTQDWAHPFMFIPCPWPRFGTGEVVPWPSIEG